MKYSIDEANKIAVQKILQAQPTLVDIKTAGAVLPIDKYTILHAGPPITWEKMCGPMKGAVIAALKYEGLAKNDQEAEKLIKSDAIKFEPCHHYNAVGPMTGVTSYSMPLYVVENKSHGNYSYSTINEGMGDVIRFGAYSDNAVKRLKWIEEVLAPALKGTIKLMNGLNLNVIIAQTLHMGDELHMRNNSSSKVFVNTLIPYLPDAVEDMEKLKEIIKFIAINNDQFFLNLAMCACKCAADAAHGIENSTLVTAIARNGVEIGIRVSGLGNKWFTAPASMVEGLYFSGFKAEDANPDIGDSAIMETGGLGGFAMAASPAIVKFLGAGSYKDAINYTLDMYEITVAEHTQYSIPNLDFRGVPIGIDLRKVVESGISPVINTAIASKNPGVGMIGAGVARVPMEVFEKALIAFADKYI